MNVESPFSRHKVLTYVNGDGTKGQDISENYRIPALVTAKSGRLVAAADARWNTYSDGGGLETAVAWSDDDGITWNTYLANYLNDNGNEWNCNSSTFIDPSLLAHEGVIYLLVDLYPYGVALNGATIWPQKMTGFHKNGTLALVNGTRTDKEEDFTYSLGQFQDGWAGIYDETGQKVEGYEVDGKFNLFQTGTGKRQYIGNLFMENHIFEVMPTSYFYLTKSLDEGESWSDPTLVNVKTKEEFAYLIGPGRGLVTSKGILIYPAYSFLPQKTSFIYSLDGGKNWTRFLDVSNELTWSGESMFVELSDGTLRCFLRTGTKCISYADVSVDEHGIPLHWSQIYQTSIPVNSNTQLSAIRYSKQIDGCDTILISCCIGKGTEGSDSCAAVDRANGKVFVILVPKDHSLVVKQEIDIVRNDEFFAYSCLAELKDGRVGLLYEKAPTEITYQILEIES